MHSTAMHAVDGQTSRGMAMLMPPAVRQGVEIRTTEYYYSEAFPTKGPIVILLAKRSWPLPMRLHHGITRPAFFSRPARHHEPDQAQGGMPWNWCFPVDKLFLYEQSVERPDVVIELRAALEEEIRSVRALTPVPPPFEGSS